MSLKIYRRDGSWHYRGTIGPVGRRQRVRGSCKTKDKDIATRFINAFEKRYWDGHFDGPGTVLTFDRAATLYLAAGKSPRFLAPVRDHLKNMLVKDITQDTISAMAMKLFGHCSGASRNRLAVIPAQAVINYCAKSKLCDHIRIERFKGDTKEKPHATLEWVRAFQGAASPHLGAYALFMFLTGARPSEAIECDLDLPGRTALLKESKIGHERRAHLPTTLVAALANIPRVEGRPIFIYRTIEDLRPAWDGAIERAKIQRLTPHCCRHGFITMLLRRGIDVKTVSWLADITPEVLLKTYAHAIKDRKLTDVLTDPELTPSTSEDAGNMLKTGTT
jgi:integrase